MPNNEELFKKIISHAKEYGFVFPSSEIYDGLSAVYDYGQNGVELKNNIRAYWWKSMVQYHENIVGLDSAIFMHPTTWKASGHVDAFSDPLIDNKDSKKRYRADTLVEDYMAKQQAKIDQEHLTGRRDLHIAWFYVTMDNRRGAAMQVRERIANRHTDGNRFFFTDVLVDQPLTYIIAIDKIHHQVLTLTAQYKMVGDTWQVGMAQGR